MLPRQVIGHKQLIEKGHSKQEIAALFSLLRLFPTPFKGIYYVPIEQERKGLFIENPRKILTNAINAFLGTSRFYYSCSTAEEKLGISWQPNGEVHIVNEILSRRIDLGRRIRITQTSSRRAKKIGTLLEQYCRTIRFHRVKNIEGASIIQTPLGAYAFGKQIARDKELFREIHKFEVKIKPNKTIKAY